MRKRMNRTWAEIPKAEVERLADIRRRLDDG